MKKTVKHYTIIELLVASGIFMLIMVLALRFYHSSQGFMLRGSKAAEHMSSQAYVLSYLKSDLENIHSGTYLDLSGGDPEEKILPISKESESHYRFYTSSYNEYNQQDETTKAVSLRLDGDRLLRAVEEVDPSVSFPYSDSQWIALEGKARLMAEQVNTFNITFCKDVYWDGSKSIMDALSFSGSTGFSNAKAVAALLVISTADSGSSSNSAAITARTDKTKQTLPFMIKIN